MGVFSTMGWVAISYWSRVVFPLSFDEPPKVTNAYQFFDLILQCLTHIRCVTVIAMIFAIFSHIGVGWVEGLARGNEVRLLGFVKNMRS